LFVLAAIFLLALAGCDKDNSVEPAGEEEISGTVNGVVTLVFANGADLSGFQVRGAVVSGSVKGTSDADLTIISIDSLGTIHFEGGHIFYNESGNVIFKTSDKGTTTTTDEVENHLTIVEGKSGEFTTKGNVNLQNGELTLTYQGKVRM